MSGETAFDHALKNQLAIILGYAGLLLSELPPGDARREDLEEIEKAATTALSLIDQREPPA